MAPKSSIEDSVLVELLESAFQHAEAATDAYLKQHPDDWFPCGFAWVRLPGRSPLVRLLKERFGDRAGHKGYPKGWEVWNPSGHPTQCMEAKLAGARAFAYVLRNHGFECYADSRMD